MFRLNDSVLYGLRFTETQVVKNSNWLTGKEFRYLFHTVSGFYIGWSFSFAISLRDFEGIMNVLKVHKHIVTIQLQIGV